jgi:hypothetical protein
MLYVDKVCTYQELNMIELKFKRRLSLSMGNKAAVVTVPSVIAEAWKEHTAVELTFDGNCIIIRPIGDSK